MTNRHNFLFKPSRQIIVALLLVVGCAGDQNSVAEGSSDDGGSVQTASDAASNVVKENVTTADGGLVTDNQSRAPIVSITVPDGSCGAITTQAKEIAVEIPVEKQKEITKPKPFAIYIMLDRSGSMIQYNSTKWKTAVSSINTFVTDTKSKGIYASFKTFPLKDGEAGDCASGTGYNEPEVKNVPLPDTSGVISTLLDDPALQPQLIGVGNTPLEGALRGLSTYCNSFQQDKQNNPGGMKCVGVLITDGEPTVCDTEPENLINIASGAFSGAGKIKTYAVGMEGAGFKFLGELAAAAGANAFNVGAATDAGVPTMTLLDALEQVREYSTEFETVIENELTYETVTLDCEWGIPDPPEYEAFDRNKVNVEFSPTGDSNDSVTLGYVESEKACGDSAKAWRYDNIDNPERVIACPKTCDVIKAAEKGKVGIIFGCEIIPLQ